MIKKLLITSLMFLFLFNQEAKATGVPVIDVAGIAQMIKDGIVRAKEFSQEIGEAKRRLKEMEATADHYKDMVDGHYSFEDIINDRTLNEHLALGDWKDIYNDSNDLSQLRGEFDMESPSYTTQAKWDRELKEYSAQKRFYEISTARNKKLQNLLDQFTTAINPAAKADLANSINYENAQIKNDSQMMESMTLLMQKKEMFETRNAEIEKRRVWMNEGIPRPQYNKKN